LRLKRYNQDMGDLKLKKLNMEEKNQSLKTVADIKKLKKECSKIMKNAFKVYEQGTPSTLEEQRDMVNRYIREITVYKDRLDITFKVPKAKGVSVMMESLRERAFEYNNFTFSRSIDFSLYKDIYLFSSKR